MVALQPQTLSKKSILYYEVVWSFEYVDSAVRQWAVSAQLGRSRLYGRLAVPRLIKISTMNHHTRRDNRF